MNRHFAPGPPGGEFALIESLFDESHFSRTGEGLGDDGFILRPGAGETWVVSTDASAEGVHYRLDWVPPEEAMRKALLANLSDINAMGGRTRLAFFNLGACRDWDGTRMSSMGEVLREMEGNYGFRVAGGDTVRKSGESFFAFTLLGRVEGRPLLRSQARPGHRIY